MFRAFWREIRKGDQGQDLAEYCLLTALLVLIAFGVFYRVSGGVNGLWNSANTTLVSGNASSGGAEHLTHSPSQ